MKKTFFILLMACIAFSCTKEENLSDDRSKTGESYALLGTADSGGSSSGSSSGEGNGNNNQGIEPGQITAAEWNDLDNWGFWTNLVNGQDYSKMPDYWSYNLSERISVIVKNSGGNAAVNLTVELLNSSNEILWTSKTDNFGKAELWPGLSKNDTPGPEYKIRVDSKEFSDIIKYDAGINEITLSSFIQEPQQEIQIAFMVDATGSMADELEYLKVELVDVISEVRKENSNTSIITGSVFYRDQGDQYITRVSDFTSTTDNTINFIKEQYADGGGDFPEAVHSALQESVNTLQWSEQSKSRLLFVLLDAPPHYENQIVGQIHSLVNSAAQKGIKLIPITASGIDKETEFLMRYFSIATNGTYVFITNDSGIGNEHLEASVGEYEVEYLNELMIRLINKYLE